MIKDYKEYQKQKALEEVVRKMIERIKESKLDYPLFHGGLYRK